MRLRVQWWWYLVVLTIAAVLVVLLASCGDDDDVNYDSDSPWFTTISPTGQRIECIEMNSWGWCREVEEP